MHGPHLIPAFHSPLCQFEKCKKIYICPRTNVGHKNHKRLLPTGDRASLMKGNGRLRPKILRQDDSIMGVSRRILIHILPRFCGRSVDQYRRPTIAALSPSAVSSVYITRTNHIFSATSLKSLNDEHHSSIEVIGCA
jgi:hypothetical protein